MKWKEKLIREVDNILKTNSQLKQYYKSKNIKIELIGIHLAIFSEPFCTLLMEGHKTVESRFSINRVSPYEKVFPGDIVFIKKSSGNICGFFIVKDTHYLTGITEQKINQIKKRYSEEICCLAVDDFWEKRASANYISLFEVTFLKAIKPIKIDKKDRTAWVVIRSSNVEPLQIKQK